jgi:5'-3' exonuclease
MGIKHLNKFLKKECNESIELLSLKSLSGKTIVVDTSIYLYKFLTDGEESLIENLLTMLNLFRFYKITPLFIFDGETPAEKKALLEKRKEEKKTAEREYYLLKDTMNENVETQKQMIELKKRFVYIKREQIELVKQFFDAYGVHYVVATGEADEMCASLVLKGTAWACLSEDMDMFVYGCSKILRYFSLINHTVVLYSMKYILKELDLTQTEFREICIMSGTDYNTNFDETINLTNTMHYFNKYKERTKYENHVQFYQWLKENTNYEVDINMLERINNMFDINNNNNNKIKDVQITNGQIQYDELKKHLYEEGFIF